MKSVALGITLLFAALCFQPYSCFEYLQDHVLTPPIDLNDQNFEETIKTNNYFVMFYKSANKISDSQSGLTLYYLAEIFNIKKDSNLKIAKVECTESPKTCSNNGISAETPILKLFKINEVEAVKYTKSDHYLNYVYKFIKEHLDLAAVENSGKNVFELTDKNYEELIKNGNWFINFHFPCCNIAKDFNIVWSEFASELDQNVPLNIGKVDCVTYEHGICKHYDIHSSPTILWLENGQKTDVFVEPRSIKFLKSFVGDKLTS